MPRKVNPITIQRLESLRQARKESIKRVADSVGLAYSFVHDLFHGKVAPGMGTLKLLAEHFNTTTDYLVGLVDDPAPGPQSPGLRRLFRATRGLSEEDLERINQVVEAMIAMKEAESKKTKRTRKPAVQKKDSLPEDGDQKE